MKHLNTQEKLGSDGETKHPRSLPCLLCTVEKGGRAIVLLNKEVGLSQADKQGGEAGLWCVVN